MIACIKSKQNMVAFKAQLINELLEEQNIITEHDSRPFLNCYISVAKL